MILVALSAAAGAVFRRWFGGTHDSPRWLRVCSGFVLAGVVAGLSTGSILGLLAGLLAALTWTLGHGSYMDMGRMPGPDNELSKPLLDWIFGPELAPSELRDFTGMALIYSVFTVPAGVALILFGHAGWFLIPSGPLVACAYWLAWEIPGMEEPTVPGEYAAGAIVYGALALA